MTLFNDSLWYVDLLPATALYLLPSIIALLGYHRHLGRVLVLNVFLGFTIIGWVIALVWSLQGAMKDIPPDDGYWPPPAP